MNTGKMMSLCLLSGLGSNSFIPTKIFTYYLKHAVFLSNYLLITLHLVLSFRSFQGKVFILSLRNLVWVFIGLIACMGLFLVKIPL